jgi:hypothetical protein
MLKKIQYFVFLVLVIKGSIHDAIFLSMSKMSKYKISKNTYIHCRLYLTPIRKAPAGAMCPELDDGQLALGLIRFGQFWVRLGQGK